MSASPVQYHKVRTHKILVGRFSDDELRNLCFELDLDYDEFDGENKSSKARSLILYMDRRGRLSELVEAARASRPEIDWDAARTQDTLAPGKAASQSLPEDEKWYQYMARRYGVGYSHIDVRCFISSTGSGTVRREVTVEAYSEISELDTFLLTPEPVNNSGERRDMGFIGAESLTNDRIVALMRPKPAPGSLSAVLSIDPPVQRGGEFRYALTERLPARIFAIGLTEKELEQRTTRYDYFGWNINRPTRKLSLHVFFPPGPELEALGLEVRFAAAAPGIPSERRQYDEEKKVPRPQVLQPEPGQYEYRLEVAYPVVGLIYILRWLPTATDVKSEARR